jgi:hypothetical protein
MMTRVTPKLRNASSELLANTEAILPSRINFPSETIEKPIIVTNKLNTLAVSGRRKIRHLMLFLQFLYRINDKYIFPSLASFCEYGYPSLRGNGMIILKEGMNAQ